MAQLWRANNPSKAGQSIVVIRNIKCITIGTVNSTIQARLDETSQKALARLIKELGWSRSKVVREGLQLLAACHLGGGGRRKLIGQGKFASGIADLASNKQHLKDFGR